MSKKGFGRILTVKSIVEQQQEAKQEDKREKYKITLYGENPDYKIKVEISSNSYSVISKIFSSAGYNDIQISLPVELILRIPARRLSEFSNGGDQ